ncbi:MAG: hypothetical protein CMN29_19765 [Sandaracinus sp.]|nr:hypothetical protein [Sandaracinus sp.]
MLLALPLRVAAQSDAEGAADAAERGEGDADATDADAAERGEGDADATDADAADAGSTDADGSDAGADVEGPDAGAVSPGAEASPAPAEPRAAADDVEEPHAEAPAEAEAESADEGAAPDAPAAPDATAPGAADPDAITIEDVRGTGEVEDDEDADESAAPVPSLHGEYRFRLHLMNDLPLQTQERTGFPDELGQNLWATNWLRLTGRLDFAGGRLALVGQIDLLDGMLFGDETVGVDAAARPRDGRTAFDASGVDPRWLYLEWTSPIGLFRAGLQPSHWGLGLLANDGAHEPVFGDYRYGNRNLRMLFATRPLGASVPFNVVLAGDLVYRDPIADLTDGERALQAVLALLYGEPERGVGAYVVYRSQRSEVDGSGAIPSQFDDELDVWIVDLFFRWDVEDPSGGRLFAAFEGLYIHGDTTLTRTAERSTFDVRQWTWAAQLGRESDAFDLVLEVGYTSGDSNPEDGTQRRATMHPDPRIGLLLFPEVLAWNTARSSTLAQSELLTGRPSPGSDLLPTDGGVSGATYLFQYALIHPKDWLDLRVGWIWARATSDVVDPYRARAESSLVNYRGGDPSSRDLGLELDAALLFHVLLPKDIEVTAGVEGAVFVPGHAFDDAAGNRMDTMGLVRLRAGLEF